MNIFITARMALLFSTDHTVDFWSINSAVVAMARYAPTDPYARIN